MLPEVNYWGKKLSSLETSRDYGNSGSKFLIKFVSFMFLYNFQLHM